MASGVIATTMPNANDIVLGEARVYGNYDLPTETEIGALQGELKLNVSRKIEDMKYNGAYGPTLDIDSVPLKRYREFIVKLSIQTLGLKYINEKIISDCGSDDSWEANDWGGSGGTYTAETSIYLKGGQSAKCEADTDEYGIHEVFDSNLDLTEHENGEVSGVSDYIAFAIYIETAEIAKLGTGLRFILHNDAEGTETDYSYYDISKATFSNGWNTFKVAKSAFTSVASGAFTGVTGVSVVLDGTPSGTVTFYVDAISLMQSTQKSYPLPLNGLSFLKMTDEGSYKKIVGDLTVNKKYMYENIAVVGQKHDGKQFIIILEHVANDGSIELALKEKTEVVSNTEFIGYYTQSSPTTTPVKIREYDV